MIEGLRVLHLIETFGLGGAEIQLAQALPLLNRTVDVRVRALGPPDTLQRRLADAGLDARVYGSDTSDRFNVRGLVHALTDELHHAPADLVHAHLFKSTVVARLARLRHGRRTLPRLVTTLHNPDYSNSEATSRLRGLARHAFDWSTALLATDAFVAVSRAVANDFEQHMGQLGPWGRMHVVHNAMDVDAFAARADAVDRAAARHEFGWQDGEFAILSIGRLTEQKDYDSLIDAVTLLRSQGIGARAVVIGDGIEGERLRAKAPAAIRFYGRADPDAITRALVACDVYVQPSRWEAFGMAILEAMAAARPVVATSVDGIPEVVHDETTGCLVPPGQPGRLAASLTRLCHDPALGTTWGQAGRARARSEFGLESWVSRTLAVYDTVVRTRDSATPQRRRGRS